MGLWTPRGSPATLGLEYRGSTFFAPGICAPTVLPRRCRLLLGRSTVGIPSSRLGDSYGDRRLCVSKLGKLGGEGVERERDRGGEERERYIRKVRYVRKEKIR